MKILTTILLVFFSVYAKADVTAFFPNDNATLIIQGNDSDANALFEAMNITPTSNGSIVTKHIDYETIYAKPVFDLTCNKSQLTGNASCTLKFFSPESVISKDQESVLMGINDQFDATAVAKMFNTISSDPHQAEVFRSLSGELHIWKTYNSSGDVVSFTMSFY